MSAEQSLTRLTVVVPVGPGDVLEPRLRLQLAGLPPQARVRVIHARADGRSQPALVSGTEASGPIWQTGSAARGRAAQQNAGALEPGGDWLWFLHADSEFAPRTLPALARFIERGEDAIGYFDLRFLGDGPPLMPLNALGAWVRSRAFGLPFGDQGLVLPRSSFERLGGFDATLEGGEDHELVWRARRARMSLRAIGAPLYTSARKYAERGWWATTSEHLSATWRQARLFSRATRSP